MKRIKICGLRRLEDAQQASELGAWALGFIFHRESKRFIEPEAAAELVAGLERDRPGRERALLVGVFVDWPLGELQAVADRVGLDVVQLHGDEDPTYARGLRGVQVWKALRVGADFDLAQLDRWQNASAVLLDTFHPCEAGGTGESFDWELARAAGERREIILAGGLRPENLAEAIRVARPWALDVASGVESEPGVKDAAKLAALFDAAAAAS